MLHYTGYSNGRGGIMAALRVLAAERRFATWLGVHQDFPDGLEALPLLRLPAVSAESGGPKSWWSAFRVARAVQAWLAEDPRRIFHGHSRAGLIVALWLDRLGCRRALATVHVLGRHRWLYRLAARQLGGRLRWLSPAMKEYYGLSPDGWADCLPDAVPRSMLRPEKSGAREGVLTFGAVGALVPVKEWETVLSAAARLDRGRRWRFIHAGSPDETESSREYAAQLHAMHRGFGLGERWQFLGQVKDMTAFHRELDCLVVSSRWEASSMAALETIAAGVPVLALEKSGTSCLVEATAAGWLFADEADLVKRLDAIAARGGCGVWRRDSAGMERFMADRVAEQHAEIYRHLLS